MQRAGLQSIDLPFYSSPTGQLAVYVLTSPRWSAGIFHQGQISTGGESHWHNQGSFPPLRVFGLGVVNPILVGSSHPFPHEESVQKLSCLSSHNSAKRDTAWWSDCHSTRHLRSVLLKRQPSVASPIGSWSVWHAASLATWSRHLIFLELEVPIFG